MIVVTGATGQLGTLVVEALLARVPASKIVAAVRTPAKAAGFAARGVEVRTADYSRPETLASAFAGAEKVLLISSSEVGRRVAQHQAVVDAARAAGARLLAYTSILNAETSSLLLAKEHQATERMIRESGIPYVFLRNGWYTENHTATLGTAVSHGAVLGTAGGGRFATATRAEYAEAAAVVLTSTGHDGKTYELGGNAPYTLAELAAEAAKQSGTPVVYKNLAEAEYAALLTGFGLPEPVALGIANADTGAARGELDTASRALGTLLGRPTAPWQEAVAAALAR